MLQAIGTVNAEGGRMSTLFSMEKMHNKTSRGMVLLIDKTHVTDTIDLRLL